MLALGCGTPSPLQSGLAAHRDVLDDHFGHRLAQMHPYVWAENGVLWLLACRWPAGAEVGVALVGGTREEARALAVAREAWARESLGVRLADAAPQTAGIRIEMVDAVAASDGSAGAGSTAVDCRLRPGDPPSVALERARVRIAREAPVVESPEPRDPRVLSDAERVGVFVHELGHGLGYQGHAVTGTVMASGRAGAREAGRRAERGRALEDSTLSALYALPEGAVLARAEIARVRTAELDRLAMLARETGWDGPFLRVGDRSARIFWTVDGAPAEAAEAARGGEGGVAVGGGQDAPAPAPRELGFVLVNLEETLRRPERALFIAEEAARAVLDVASPD